jgi:cytochrome c556
MMLFFVFTTSNRTCGGRAMQRAISRITFVGLAVLLVGLNPMAQVKKGQTRAAATKYLMRAVNQPMCAGLDASLKGSGPTDEKAWDTAMCQASVLNEMGYLLMEDGRCPDSVWANAAKELREGSGNVLAALEKHDLEAARGSFKTVTAACGACHKAHKK